MSGHLVCPKDVAHPRTNTMPCPALSQMRQHLYKSRRRDFAPCKGEIPRVQIGDLCEGCISLSNAEVLLSTEKAVWYFDKEFPLFRPVRAKTRGNA